MELSSLTPELPKLLAEMGVKYDPERLAAALSSRPAGARMCGGVRRALGGWWQVCAAAGFRSAVMSARSSTVGAPVLPRALVHLCCPPPPADLAARSVQVAAKLGGFITRVLADVASGSFDANTPLRAQQLRAVLSSLGPSFVKTGQALSGELLGLHCYQFEGC